MRISVSIFDRASDRALLSVVSFATEVGFMINIIVRSAACFETQSLALGHFDLVGPGGQRGLSRKTNRGLLPLDAILFGVWQI